MADTFNDIEDDDFDGLDDEGDDMLTINLDGSPAPEGIDDFGGEKKKKPSRKKSRGRHAVKDEPSSDIFDDDVSDDSDIADPYVDPNNILNEVAEEEQDEESQIPVYNDVQEPDDTPVAEEQPEQTQQPVQNEDYSQIPIEQQYAPQQPYPQYDDSNQYPAQQPQQDYSQVPVEQQYASQQQQDYQQQPQQYQQYQQQPPQQYAPQQPQDYQQDGMASWGQQYAPQQPQDYQQYQQQPVEQYQQPEQQYDSQTDTSQQYYDAPVEQPTEETSEPSPSANFSLPQPSMIQRIITVSDMIRNDMSEDEKEASKLILDLKKIKTDETSELVYAFLNAKHSTMEALDHFLESRSMADSNRAFYLIRLSDASLQIIISLGGKMGGNADEDSRKKSHIDIAQLAEQTVSSVPESSIELMEAVQKAYLASKDILHG